MHITYCNSVRLSWEIKWLFTYCLDLDKVYLCLCLGLCKVYLGICLGLDEVYLSLELHQVYFCISND